MNTRNPVEDQFSKLHPRLPLNTRIGIIGGGPSGLSAAYALSKLGYSDVTVLEKYHSVSGMCESVEIEGRVYDLGGQVLAANSAPFIFHLAKEAEAELEEMDTHKLALIDSSTGAIRDIEVADDYVSLVSLTLDIQDKAKDLNRIGVNAVSELASDPTLEYLQNRGFKSLPKSVQYGYTASGYGYIQDMPYAYIHEFTRTSMAGKIRRFKGGYMSLWQKISQTLPIKLRCNTEVTAVRRDSAVVNVETKTSNGESEQVVFDKLIISGSFPFKNSITYRLPPGTSTEPETEVLDKSELENELLSKVRTIDYYTTVVKIKGFEHIPVGFFYFAEYMDDPATIGNPVAMQRFHADTDIFLFWSYGNSVEVTGSVVTEFTMKAVKSMGGKVETVILQRRFKYFPHVGSEDMKTGFYDRLESELQGRRNTYYIGGLMAFELTERNSSYAMASICKHFASTDPIPPFPYVKSLLPLQLDRERRRPNLPESPGVEFPDLSSLDGYLKHWGTHKIIKNRTLYTWINEEGAVVSQRTYQELNSNAAYIASKLLMNKKPPVKSGDRVLLVHLPGLDFVDAFFGCLRAKVIPVPVLPPDPMQRGGQALMKIENIAKVSNAVAILSTIGYHAAVRAGSVKQMISFTGKSAKTAARWPNLPWFHTDSWVKSSKFSPLPEVPSLETESQPDDLCFLQFTSGSTGDAKGVMITHGGLVHNVKLMRRRYRSSSETVLVSWLPQYHDMGLIGGLFTALVSGGTSVLFSPLAFIKNPLLWLQTITKYKGTHSAGPNFAFELLIRRLDSEKTKRYDYDLSSMVFFMVAAEPVRQKTLRRFLELTRPFGLTQEVMAPGYGLAENCVFVSCAFGEHNPIWVDWEGRVCCGYVGETDDVDIRIVDPDNGVEVEEDGKVGEIWICSPSSGVGYWGREEFSRTTFSNVLEKRRGRKYTRTGDLGRVIDGKLFITGRIKDLIIVAGRNIYSSDIEKTVENSSEILRPGCCAVIGVPEDVLSSKGITVPDSSDQVGLVVIAEVRDGKPVGNDVVKQIEARVAEEHGVAVSSVKLIRPRTISKTTSGKIKRFECLKQFVDETLSIVPEPIKPRRSLTRSFTTGTCQEGNTPRPQLAKLNLPSSKLSNKDIVEFLKKLVSDQTGISIDNISDTESLVSYGIDSIGVVRASQKLSDFLGVPVGAVDIFTATCIADLANFSETLLIKSQPQQTTSTNLTEPETLPSDGDVSFEASTFHRFGICLSQIIAMLYVAAILAFPAYLSIVVFVNSVATCQAFLFQLTWLHYMIPIALAPFAWIGCMVLTGISVAFFGNSFLRPNYALSPQVSIWSVDFVKWWALYKAQDISSKVLAVHLRGTVFLNLWFEMLGAKIGSSVLLDTVDITDPALVSIGDGVVVAEGALIQGHEVRNGVLRFSPIRIGRNSAIGPYAVIQKGSVVGENAEVLPLQTTEARKPLLKSARANTTQKDTLAMSRHNTALSDFVGIYTVGLLSSISAAIVYLIYIWLSQTEPSLQELTFLCIGGALHWLPFTIAAYATMSATALPHPLHFATSLAVAYFTHGSVLTILTGISTRLLASQETNSPFNIWLSHRITISCHLKFANLLSGTEAFCVYLRFLGAQLGKHCSIRAINPVADPQMVSLGAGVHLGDFCRLIPGFYSSNGYIRSTISVGDNSVIGSQSLVLPGSVVEKDVILGALSVAPANSVLQRGGIFIGSDNPIMIKNTLHSLDERIEEMDMKYKKIVGNLAASLATTTLKVKSRYFHRIGVAAKGYLQFYDEIKGLPDHNIFGPSKRYPVIVRHSNSLSADDDARIDARGAAIRIFADETGTDPPVLDLTLKTGKAFYARTIADFATWLVCGLAAREEHVKRVPHVRDAVWTSLRRPDSFTELHYYSNISRLFRFSDGNEMYVKFKLRPYDKTIGEDSGKVEPTGILPPETGAIPRDSDDTRPLLFLDNDFRNRVGSPNGVRYIFQLQIRPVPKDETERDIALDCTKPWDESRFPYIDIGEIALNEALTSEESDKLEFNPFVQCREVDVIHAKSSSESASIDHGRSLIYEICQRLRNAEPLPEAWRMFLEQSDVKVDLSGCPMAAGSPKIKDSDKVTLSRTWYQTSWALLGQPLLQTILPYFLMGLVIYGPLKCLKQEIILPYLPWLLPMFWVSSGTLAAVSCIFAKWVLVGKKKEDETVLIWSVGVFMDTIWQAFRTLVGDYFVGMTTGSWWFLLWMKLMGSYVELDRGTYVDSMGASLNPEMVEIEGDGSVEKEALLFGHVYDGEGGRVKFGKIVVGDGGFVGSRAVAMPGVVVESGGSLGALCLAMKSEVVRGPDRW